MMELDTLDYWNDFDVDVLPSEPALGATYQFLQKRSPVKAVGDLTLEVTQRRSDWLPIRVRGSGGQSWTGLFEPGVEGISGIYATPSESVLCVVVKGQGYWVPVLSPESYELIPSIPIKKIIAVPNRELMVFVDFVRLAAYGVDGFAWQTGSLSWDGLKITEVKSDVIEGTAWDAPNSQDVQFVVDVTNGSHTGGSSP